MVAVTALASAAHADLRDRQHKVRDQIGSAQGDLQESSKELTQAAGALRRAQARLQVAQNKLAVAQGKVDTAARKDAEMQVRLQAAEHDLAVARTKLEVAKAQMVEQRRQIGELAANNYANGDPALMGLSVILNSQDVGELTSQMNTVDSLMDRQSGTLERLTAARLRLTAREAKVEQMTATVAVQRKAAAVNLVRTQALEQAAAKVRSQVASAVADDRAARAAATRARAADAVKLRQLKAQESSIKKLILKRARAQKKSSGGYSGSSGGFLSRPVPGEVTSPYGWRTHPIYGYWGLHDGTDFRAYCGTPMRAVASGTVIARQWSDVYGNRLYLDLGRVNGRNMTAVYNHATSYKASVGERVSRGEVLGWSGTTGWSTACHLHFTVLVDGNPVDPMNYM
ncbi:MAG: peptidoglycan DD-metalloendopeptidase family protein [Marmoricola sp.]